jgi:hypothetical protein
MTKKKWKRTNTRCWREEERRRKKRMTVMEMIRKLKPKPERASAMVE